MTIDELKARIQKHKERGREIIAETKRLQSHFEKMQAYYSEWEDDMTALEREIDDAKKEHGIQPEELEEFNALDDLLGVGNDD